MRSAAYFDTRDEALAEVHRRKTNPEEGGVIVRIEESGYGGYKVVSIPVDLYIDSIANEGLPGLAPSSAKAKARAKAAYG